MNVIILGINLPSFQVMECPLLPTKIKIRSALYTCFFNRCLVRGEYTLLFTDGIHPPYPNFPLTAFNLGNGVPTLSQEHLRRGYLSINPFTLPFSYQWRHCCPTTKLWSQECSVGEAHAMNPLGSTPGAPIYPINSTCLIPILIHSSAICLLL